MESSNLFWIPEGISQHDIDLINSTRRLPHSEDVFDLIPQAESQVTKDRLNIIGMYKYHREEAMSGMI